VGWAVELLGDESDLTLLAQVSCPPTWAVKQGQGGAYFLESDAFDALPDASAVNALAAREALPVVRATAKMSFPRIQLGLVAVGPGVVHEDASGNRTATRIIYGSASLSSGSNLPVGTTGPVPQVPLHTVIASLRHDPHVVDALRSFDAADGGYWTVELYKVMEVIALDVGETSRGTPSRNESEREQALRRGQTLIQTYGWITSAEWDSFRAVHDPALTGPMARHGVQTRQSPPSPMSTRVAATKFVRRVLEDWLRWK
jgi:hypothetical protein